MGDCGRQRQTSRLRSFQAPEIHGELSNQLASLGNLLDLCGCEAAHEQFCI